MRCRKCNDVIIEADKDPLIQQLKGLCSHCYANHHEKIDAKKLDKVIKRVEAIHKREKNEQGKNNTRENERDTKRTQSA